MISLSGCATFHGSALSIPSICFFFFNDTATTEIYTLSLHDALPICRGQRRNLALHARPIRVCRLRGDDPRPAEQDRKSTRLNSSHSQISYAVFCLKKKKRFVSPGWYRQRAPKLGCVELVLHMISRQI